VRIKADREHPSYALGEEAYQQGITRKDAGDFDGADASFRSAIDYFAQAKPYDATQERAAKRAQRRAYESMPVSWAAGAQAIAAGEAAKAAYDYEKAYRFFQQAETQFLRARFDQSALDELADAKRTVNTSAADYQQALRIEGEAKQLFAAGDGPAAQEKYELALSAIRRAGRRIDDTGLPDGGRDTADSGSGVDREARRAARAARSAANELKDVTDEWSRNGEINRQTQSFYDRATELYAEAAVAWSAEDWKTSQSKFLAATSEYRKVSNKKR
jgi:tetratricopeptide (TPR) repeat protein